MLRGLRESQPKPDGVRDIPPRGSCTIHRWRSLGTGFEEVADSPRCPNTHPSDVCRNLETRPKPAQLHSDATHRSGPTTWRIPLLQGGQSASLADDDKIARKSVSGPSPFIEVPIWLEANLHRERPNATAQRCWRLIRLLLGRDPPVSTARWYSDGSGCSTIGHHPVEGTAVYWKSVPARNPS